MDLPNQGGRDYALQQTAQGACKPHVHLHQTQLHAAVGALLDQVHIVHAHDLAPAGVDDLLVEQVLAHREPSLIGLIDFEQPFAHVQPQHEVRPARQRLGDVRGERGNLVVPCHERLESAARKKEIGDAIRLLGGLDEQFTHSPDEVALRVVGFCAHEFCCMKHSCRSVLKFTPPRPPPPLGKEKTREPKRLGRG